MSMLVWQLRKHDAEWQQRHLSWFHRLQLRLCQRVVMVFAVQAVGEAYIRDIIDGDQFHEITGIMNRRMYQEVQP